MTIEEYYESLPDEFKGYLATLSEERKTLIIERLYNIPIDIGNKIVDLFISKYNLRTSLVEKGFNMSEVPFTDYWEKVHAILANVEDEPLRITDNIATIICPDGIRYNPIEVYIPKPTLNEPSLSISGSGILTIGDAANGNFTSEYIVYLNNIEYERIEDTSINLNEMSITDTDIIGVVATSEFFNNSTMATISWDEQSAGTLGLVYGGVPYSGQSFFGWKGLGEVNKSEIRIASEVDGKTVVIVGTTTSSGPVTGNTDKMTIVLPDTITIIGNSAFINTSNKTIVFGANTSQIGTQALYMQYYYTNVLDFRNAKIVPSLTSGQWYGNNTSFAPRIIVPDALYEEWRTATNWSALPDGKIIKASDYEAQ